MSKVGAPAVSAGTPEATGWSKVTARVDAGRRIMRATRWDCVRSRRRYRDEIKTQVYDWAQKRHRESWYHPELDEDIVKLVPLKPDAGFHGEASGHLFRLLHRRRAPSSRGRSGT